MIRMHPPDEHAVAVMLLDRPDTCNALDEAMLEAITDHCAAIDPDQTRALVLAGEGDAFCAGFDLTRCRRDAGAMAAMLTGLSRAARALRRLPIPVVGAAHGAAVAGGCALMGAADFVITNRAAKFGYPVVRLGVSPAVTSPLLRLAVGDAHCRERLLDPGLIDADEAARIGLACEVLDAPADVRTRALQLAAALAAKPAHSVRATKAWLNRLDTSLDDDLFNAALAVSRSTADTDESRALLEQVWKKG